MVNARARAIARLPRIINGTLELAEVLERATEQALELVGAERATLLLIDPDGAPRCVAARGLDCARWSTPRYRFAREVAGRVLEERRARLTSDAQVDERPDLAQSRGIQSILCVPLLVGVDEPIGTLYVERRLPLGAFTADDLELLETIALHVSVAIENARRYGQAREEGRLEGATAVAEAMVLSLLPRESPSIPGYDLAARWQSAHEISADFYDLFPLASAERWGLVVADVADRGPPAALFMALTRSIIRGSVAAAAGPAEGIRQANRLIHQDAREGRYVVAFYGELDRHGELEYVNVGMGAPLWWRADRGALARLAADERHLGICPEIELRDRRIRLGRGDLLILYSDGLVEQRGEGGRVFGIDRLERLVAEHAALAAGPLAATLWEELQLWRRGRPPADDLLLVVLRYDPL